MIASQAKLTSWGSQRTRADSFPKTERGKAKQDGTAAVPTLWQRQRRPFYVSSAELDVSLPCFRNFSVGPMRAPGGYDTIIKVCEAGKGHVVFVVQRSLSEALNTNAYGLDQGCNPRSGSRLLHARDSETIPGTDYPLAENSAESRSPPR